MNEKQALYVLFMFAMLMSFYVILEISGCQTQNESFEGGIKEKFMVHRGCYITLYAEKTYRTIPYSNLYTAIDTGDFIIKRKGEKKYILIRGIDTTVYGE